MCIYNILSGATRALPYESPFVSRVTHWLFAVSSQWWLDGWRQFDLLEGHCGLEFTYVSCIGAQ